MLGPVLRGGEVTHWAVCGMQISTIRREMDPIH